VVVTGLARALKDEHIPTPHVISDLHRELPIRELDGFNAARLYLERLTDSLRESRIGTACENEKWTRHRSSFEVRNEPFSNCLLHTACREHRP
jgi:hypothetical protein